TSATSATDPQNQELRVAEVADEGLQVADEVADDLADPLPLSDWEAGKVAQVALVAEQPGKAGDLEIPDFFDRRPSRTCAQCNAFGDDLERHIDTTASLSTCTPSASGSGLGAHQN